MQHDIDALPALRELHDLMGKYDINGLVQTYINNFPYNYEDRLVLLFKGQVIDFFTASLGDIVIAKLHSYRIKDIDKSRHARLVYIYWFVLHADMHIFAMPQTRGQLYVEKC